MIDARHHREVSTRQASAAVYVLVLIVILSGIASAYVVLRNSRSQWERRLEQQLDRGWMMEGALERTCVLLQRDPDFKGDRWQVPTAFVLPPGKMNSQSMAVDSTVLRDNDAHVTIELQLLVDGTKIESRTYTLTDPTDR